MYALRWRSRLGADGTLAAPARPDLLKGVRHRLKEESRACGSTTRTTATSTGRVDVASTAAPKAKLKLKVKEASVFTPVNALIGVLIVIILVLVILRLA